jgi:polyisoprenoid-binding protein YceI
MNIKFFAVCLIDVALCWPMVVMAAPIWKIVPENSSITFTATQNNSPVTGSFKSFGTFVRFDPVDLKASRVEVNVAVASVKTSYSQIADTLLTPDWFNASVFPHAIFTAKNFMQVKDNTYAAKGLLTIRDKTIPIVLMFKLDEYSANKAHATGWTTVKRTQFGIGQGEWAKTGEVKDDVTVTFDVSATK